MTSSFGEHLTVPSGATVSAQRAMDKAFPRGARVVVTEHFEFYAPRVMVEESTNGFIFFLWDVLGVNQPLVVETTFSEPFTLPLNLEGPDGVICIDASFPEELQSLREYVLRSVWFGGPGE